MRNPYRNADNLDRPWHVIDIQRSSPDESRQKARCFFKQKRTHICLCEAGPYFHETCPGAYQCVDYLEKYIDRKYIHIE